MRDIPLDVPRAPGHAEYILVRVAGRENERIQVLVDGVPNGLVGKVIQVTRNEWEISLDLPNSPVQEVDVRNTTYDSPLVVDFHDS